MQIKTASSAKEIESGRERITAFLAAKIQSIKAVHPEPDIELDIFTPKAFSSGTRKRVFGMHSQMAPHGVSLGKAARRGTMAARLCRSFVW
jgi:hypothetical protein